MVSVRWTDIAVENLADIGDYIGKDSIKHIDIITIHHSARLLENNPALKDIWLL